MSQVVSLLTIDARGAEAGSAVYVRSMQAAQAAVDRIRDAEDRATAARERSLGIMTTQQDGMSKTARAWEKLRASTDPVIAQQKEIERATLAADAAFRRGLATQEEAARVVDLVKARYQTAANANDNFATSAANVNKQTGLARHELINLGRQVQDIGTQLAMGQAPMQVFAAQAAQVADIFMSTEGSIGGFLRQVGGGALRFALSGAGVATAGAAIGAGAAYAAYSYAESQKEVQKALLGVGAASGATVAGINRVADAEAAAAKVSVASAREMLSAYAATGKVDPTRLPGLTDFSRQYAAFQGIGNADAAKELAAAFSDPARGAETLAGKLGGLSESSRRWIADQQAAGNMLGAQTALLRTFAPQVEGATERTNLFARAFDAVTRSASNAAGAVGRALNGPTDAERLASLQQQRDRLQASTGLGVNNQLRLLEQQIRPLEAIVELERQRSEIILRRAKADSASLAAGLIVEGLDPYLKTMREIVAQRAKLDEAIKLNPGVQDLDEWRQWSKLLEDASKTMLTTGERQRQTNDLTVRAIGARTLAERTAVEIARINLDVAGDAVKMKERELLIVGKINEMQAQANREARDALRSSQDQVALAGLRPYQRERLEAQFRYRDNLERFGGSVSIPTAGTMANGLRAQRETVDASQRSFTKEEFLAAVRLYESNNQNVYQRAVGPNGGYNPSTGTITGPSTAQGYYQITNSTWRDIAAAAGIDLKQYPNAMSAPREVQDRAASALYDQRGASPWAPYNANLRSWMGGFGGQGAGNSSAASILANDNQIATTKAYNEIILTANDSLAAQQKQLEATRDTLFMSTEEIARAQKFQELYNQAVQQGGTALASELLPSIQRTAAGYGDLARQQELLKNSQDALRSIGDIGKDALKGFISDLRAGKSAGEAFQSTLNRIADKLIDMAINDLFGKAFGGTGGGFGTGIFGLLGRALGIGGGGVTSTISSGTGGLYADGGYTGHGGKYDPAGIVHRGEYVFDAAATSRIGVHALESIRRGLPGYAGGGYVPPQSYLPPSANSNAPAQRPAPIVNNVQVVAPPGSQVRQEERKNESGGKDLLVMIDEAVADRLATPGTSSNRAARTTFGMQPALTRR